MVAGKRETGLQKRWRPPTHCSICKSLIWFYPITIKEPVGAPEPRRVWELCKVCHDELLVKMRNSPVRSPTRLRIALGLVAAERSPEAYNTNSHVREQRLFAVIMWLLFLCGLLHLVLFLVIFAATK